MFHQVRLREYPVLQTVLDVIGFEARPDPQQVCFRNGSATFVTKLAIRQRAGQPVTPVARRAD
jgi:hypothetical protein